jgi:DUF1680 family protein
MNPRIAWILAFSLGSLLPSVLRAADRAPPLMPAQVKLTGWLGQRVEANWKHRLLTVSLDERLRPFQNPTESGGWSGEHIGKWLHAAAITFSYTHDPELRKRMDRAVKVLLSSQGPDGYLGTYTQKDRWGGWDVWTHKYNLLGLLTYYEYTGEKPALEAARKIGDLLVATFGEGRRDIIASGTHVGMAATSVLEPMMLLYRHTQDPRYLEFARYITRAYDQPNGPKIIATLTATHSVAKTANRKAYEMMSNLVGLCELYRSTGERRYLEPCLYAYQDIVENQMYVTGGTSLGEHFQDPHHLPNTGAVSENCAQVTWLQLCLQLYRITGEVQYVDTLERIVYNHLLAAQKPSGEALCYFTPLRGQKPYTAGTNCCTSSGPRGIALTTTFAYTVTPEAVAVNLYESSSLETQVRGVKTKLTQTTRYPVEGSVRLEVEPEKPVPFELRLRIPGWCQHYTAALGGQPLPANTAGGQYLTVSRQWKAGDRVEIDFAMPAVLVRGTYSNDGLVAVRRGPLVLAFDSRFNPGLSPANVSPLARADGTVTLTAATDPEGIAAHVFRGQGVSLTRENDEPAMKNVPLVLSSFAEAGATGSTIAVWMPAVDKLRAAAASPFLFARESYSKTGNVSGSIADGDPSTWRVTFDNTRQHEAWFAVQRDRPVAIDRVVFAHGRCYHDGGWWDASKGKPRIQTKKTADGPWEDIARLDSYPATSATDHRDLVDGKLFVVILPSTRVVGIRVIGTPACGDNPKQSFASCAELQGLSGQ